MDCRASVDYRVARAIQVNRDSRAVTERLDNQGHPDVKDQEGTLGCQVVYSKVM